MESSTSSQIIHSTQREIVKTKQLSAALTGMIVLRNLIFAEWNDTSQITCLQNVSAAEASEQRFAIAIADPGILNVKAEARSFRIRLLSNELQESCFK